MAHPKFLSPISCMLLVSLFFQSVLAHSDDQKQNPFEFIKHLQGCHKGEKVKGLQELKQYLEKFGYLDYNQSSLPVHAGDDDFDELLESAVKMYQLNHHLKVTGTLDSQTVSTMMMPRCGMADIVNGTSRMRSGKRRSHHRSSNFRTVAHFSFFDGNPKWPPSKYHLTYALSPGTRADVVGPVSRAFNTWASATHFTFSQVQNYAAADIKIAFASRDHGDNAPFDGPSGVIAHAFQPTIGMFHYDADEQWSVGPASGSFDMETVALHEIGHLLGLGHSSVERAIMYPSISPGISKGLDGDDVQGIKTLYGV
ncbi:metalloendoproteinase 3-MMP-like [Syzygium oleosum]|uniref:metalloendoproteinase 3-MMP-like n=1 Tax=Syzygium oleosum TaxID=219896 RepID=UPI0011D1D390|nr:metalloendoproteinase 3-MMP-like [Syzygium oleosum]